MRISVPVLLLLAVAVLLPPGHSSFCSIMDRCNGNYSESTVLDVDLTTGLAATPPSGGASWFSSPTGSGKCGKQAIAIIPFPAAMPSNSKVCIKFDLYLDDSKGWNFLISETTGDGYGGTGHQKLPKYTMSTTISSFTPTFSQATRHMVKPEWKAPLPIVSPS